MHIKQAFLNILTSLIRAPYHKYLLFHLYPDDSGMIFAWDRKKIQCMWMKNTSIPLSIAYIEDTGEIIGIYDMVPLSRKSVCSKKPALYALEVNKGWFKKNGFHVGDFININAVIQNAK